MTTDELLAKVSSRRAAEGLPPVRVGYSKKVRYSDTSTVSLAVGHLFVRTTCPFCGDNDVRCSFERCNNPWTCNHCDGVFDPVGPFISEQEFRDLQTAAAIESREQQEKDQRTLQDSLNSWRIDSINAPKETEQPEPQKPTRSFKSILITALKLVFMIAIAIVFASVAMFLVVWVFVFVATKFGFAGVAALCAIWFLAWIFWR